MRRQGVSQGGGKLRIFVFTCVAACLVFMNMISLQPLLVPNKLVRIYNQSGMNMSTLQRLLQPLPDSKEYVRKYIQRGASWTEVDGLIGQGVFIDEGLAGKVREELLQKDTAPAQKDLVMGAAKGLDPKNVAVFCRSLRAVSDASVVDIVVFINDPEIGLNHEVLRKCGAITRPWVVAAGKESYHPSSTRWDMYYEFLREPKVRATYRRVWMMDTRDVMFQKDPFEMLPVGKRSFYAFAEMNRIRNCGWNSGWVKDCFGQKVLDDIGDNIVINSGVSMGDIESVIEYLRIMVDIVSATHNTELSKKSSFPQCERNGVDQGVHNVLVWKKAISNLTIWMREGSPVANMGSGFPESEIKKGVVYNAQGDTVAVVHQFDRWPELQKLYFEKFSSDMGSKYTKKEMEGSQECSKYAHREEVNVFGESESCWVGAGGSAGAGACCKMCNERPQCQGFLYSSSFCKLSKCKAGAEIAHAGAVSAFVK